jgi:hypothetical protein
MTKQVHSGTHFIHHGRIVAKEEKRKTNTLAASMGEKALHKSKQK